MKQGSVSLTGNQGGAVSGANNGISASGGFAQLGDPAGTIGSGILLNARQINTGWNDLKIVIPGNGVKKTFGAIATQYSATGFCFADQADNFLLSDTTLLTLNLGNAGVITGLYVGHAAYAGPFYGVHVKNGSSAAAAEAMVKCESNGSPGFLISMSTHSTTHATFPYMGEIRTSGQYGLVLNANHGSASILFVQGTAAGTERMRVSVGGNLLIGSAAESGGNQKLQVTGKALVTTTTDTSNIHILGRNAAGEILHATDIFTGSANTTDATPTTIYTVQLLTDESKSFTVHLAARDLATGENKVFLYQVGVKNIGGVVTNIGAGATLIGAALSEAAFTGANVLQATISGSSQLLQVVGTAAKTIQWELMAFGRVVYLSV